MIVEELTRAESGPAEDLAAVVERGLAHHRREGFAAAEAAYRQALLLAPKDGAVWHLLGIALTQQDRPAEAAAALERATLLRPADPDPLRALSGACLAGGALDRARSAAEAAVRLDPASAQSHLALGRALRASKQPEAARLALVEALRLDADDPAAALALGHCYRDLRDYGRAGIAYRQVLRLEAGHVDALNGLGVALYEQGDFDGACLCYANAFARAPEALEAVVNFGNILLKRHDIAGALAVYEHAVARQPAQPEFRYNYANSLDYCGRLEEAVEQYGRVLALDPGHINAFWNRTLSLLTAGRFAEGFGHYERRWEVPSFQSPRFSFARPLWEGGSLAGKTLLLHAEQGFGDTIQFVRYAPLLAERGARVILQCQKELVRLLRGAPGVSQVLAWEAAPPPYDLQLPLMSVCQRLGTTPETIPASAAYLQAQPVELADPGLLDVGLVWAGNPTHLNDANRSLPFETLRELLCVPDVRFHSLQMGVPVPEDADIADLTLGIGDFADTATRIAALDLVISVDTSTVHLAGALGKPTLLLLPMRSDWRWFREREDTPWYPSLRLLRQPRSGDWSSVMARARGIVEALVRQRREGR